jgi:DNA mismatch repair protein MSH3
VCVAVLQKLPDLARGLARIQYGRCNLRELHTFLKAFNKVATSFPTFTSPSPSEVGFRSPLLNRIIWALPKLRVSVQALVSQINMTQLELEKKAEIWTNPDRWPNIEDTAEVKLEAFWPIVPKLTLGPAQRGRRGRTEGRAEEQ